jgi:GNAT superfamily N-acetyltransferase
MDLSFEVTETIQPESRDAIACGLIGDLALGWLSIHALWVAEEHRGAGIGSRLLQSAEDAAQRNGCRAAILDTLSFQAPEFYEKRGYVRVGVVEDYRGGMRRIFMQKRLLGSY